MHFLLLNPALIGRTQGLGPLATGVMRYQLLYFGCFLVGSWMFALEGVTEPSMCKTRMKDRKERIASDPIRTLSAVRGVAILRQPPPIDRKAAAVRGSSSLQLTQRWR